MRQLTFGYLTLSDCPQTEIIDVAKASGFNSLGLRVEGRRTGDGYPFTAVGNAAKLREIRARLASTGMRLSNVNGKYLEAHTTTDDIKGLVDAAAELGCPFILANGYDEDEKRTTDNLAKMCELAQAAGGMRVAVEFVPYQSINSLKMGYDMVKRTGMENAGLVPDPLHLSRSGGSPADFSGLDLSRVFYAQICDAPAKRPPTLEGCLNEARTGRLYPGEGGLPLFAYLDAIPADCELEIEVANAADQKLPPIERGQKVAAAFRKFMAAYEAHRKN
jgi:sugar phosphate isomerase/epimerase